MSNKKLINTDYNKLFLKELKKLNPAQKIAVDQIEGPVLVIAGPGTGKTHILTSRIGSILLNTDAQPHNVLCLTFTDAGVIAMRERLIQLIGPEAHRVHIFTFHSFCNKIIKERMDLFGRQDLEPLSDLERIEIIRKLIDQLPIDHPLKQGKRDPYFYEKQLYDLFQRMKSEDWSSTFIKSKVESYLQELPSRPEYIYKINTKKAKKGDLKTAKIQEQEERMQRLMAAAAIFPDYQIAMRRARRYDFSDMIIWVLREFKRNEALLRNYQEQYLYFLVDEFQDTNGVQNAILHKLIEYWNNPNVFIVGDDDQSIFEFQGARLKNLLDFHHEFKEDLTLVMLKDNYRSSQKILDSSKILIEHNDNRAVSILNGLDKTLKAKNKEFGKSKVFPKVIAYPNRAHEDTDIVNQIENLYKEGFPLKEIAIIYAKHKQSRNIIDLLEKKQIPYNTKRNVNILEQPLIVNVRMLLKYLQLELDRPYQGEFLLFKILHFNFFQLPAECIGKLSFAIAQNEKKLKWRDTIGDESFLKNIQIPNFKQFSHISKLINQWILDVSNIPLVKLIEKVINQGGLLRYLLQIEEKEWPVQVVSTFLEFVKNETDRNPRITLKRLLDILQNMDDNRISIGINKTIISDNGVHLLTAHSSKGLEYQKVFIIDAVKDNWEPTTSSSLYRFPLPDTLTFSGEEDALEARRRLFYVAMTRAKGELQISYSQKDPKGKPLQHTQFLDEIIRYAPYEIQEKQLDADTILDAQLSLLQSSPQVKKDLYNKAKIDELLTNFSMSISSLNQFIRCPLSFYYEKILRIPTSTSEAAAYGTAMHYALQKLFDHMRYSKADEKGNKQFPSVSSFIKYFDHEMDRQSGYFSKKEYNRRLEMGRSNLSNYYQQYINNWNKEVRTEFVVRNLELNGVPLNGIIDRIDFYPQHKIHIVDYKTGSHNSSKLQSPTSKKPEGGTYWRQLVFYKIIYEAYQKNNPHQVHSAEIAYLDPNSRGEFISKEIIFENNEVEIVKDLIQTSYKKIMAHDFFDGCGEKSCPWCSFITHNMPINQLNDLEIEALDDN